MNSDEFLENIKVLNLELSEKTLNKLECFYNLLTEYNKKVNLTRIITKKDVYLKHFYDSLCIVKSEQIKENGYICDVGTGAGFPGIVIAIFFPTIKIDLIESNGKKCKFLNIVKEKLNLNNIKIINDRAEEYAKKNKEKYDIVTSRAVASLNILSEICIPMVKEQGYFIPLKGNVEKEIKTSKIILMELSSVIEKAIKYTLPIENSKRTILIIKKNKKTLEKYPRDYKEIIKSKK